MELTFILLVINIVLSQTFFLNLHSKTKCSATITCDSISFPDETLEKVDGELWSLVQKERNRQFIGK
jgi:hypothetical protein